MTCGVYCIKNIITNQCYVGSSKHIEIRWGRHKAELRRGNHRNLHLQNSYNFYGPEAFAFLIVEECDEVERINLETCYIEKYRNSYSVFNHTLVASPLWEPKPKLRERRSIKAKQMHKNGLLKAPVRTKAQCQNSSIIMKRLNKEGKLNRGFVSKEHRDGAIVRCKSGKLNTPEQRRKASENIKLIHTRRMEKIS